MSSQIPATCRALLIDVDGTLLSGLQPVSPRTVQALAALQQRGWTVALATGRSIPECREIFPLFPADTVHVLCAGALLAQSTGQVLWEERIPSATVEQLCQRALTLGADFGFSQGDRYFASPSKAERKRNQNVSLGEYLHLTDWSTPLLSLEGVSQELMAEVNALQNITVKHMKNSRGEPYLDITQGDFTKGTGAQRWAERQGFQLQELAAAGDGDNDTELLQEVGWGVAMGNAVEAIKKVSNQVIGRCDEDGLAIWMESLPARQAV